MAYQASGLSTISYANSFTLWHYRTEDSWEKLAWAGYFDQAAKMLRQGDFMFVNCDVGSPNPTHGVLVVMGNDAHRVSVSATTETTNRAKESSQ